MIAIYIMILADLEVLGEGLTKRSKKMKIMKMMKKITDSRSGRRTERS